MNDTATTDSTVQKLKLLVNNAGAPQMVKDSLLQEIDQKGATPEVMDRIIQSFETEKDILTLTINSVTNLKKQVTEGAMQQDVSQAITPPPLMSPTQQPEVPQQQVTASAPVPPQTQFTTAQPTATTSDDVKKKQEELEKLLEELKSLQAESPTDNKTNPTTTSTAF